MFLIMWYSFPDGVLITELKYDGMEIKKKTIFCWHLKGLTSSTKL